MSEGKKTIQINPDLFKVSGKTRKKKDATSNSSSATSIPKLRIKETSASSQKNKTTKNQILKYIRQQQQHKYDEMLKHGAAKHDANHVREDLIGDFETDFKQSLDYLNSITEKTKTSLKPNPMSSTLKNTGSLVMEPQVIQHYLGNHNDIIPVDENVNNIVPDVFSTPYRVKPPAPQYGCLKGGQKPTYRVWNTMKNMNSLHLVQQPQITQSNIIPSPQPAPTLTQTPSAQPHTETTTTQTPKSLQERLANPSWLNTQPKLAKQVGAKHAIERKMKELAAQRHYKPRKHQRKTLRRTFVVGKSKHYPTIGVLVSNKTLRNQISNKKQQLKQVPIDDVKKTLIKKGLIKIGSIAPNDVLRQMYESVNLMCGDVHNHNPDNLIYNYLNSQDTTTK